MEWFRSEHAHDEPVGTTETASQRSVSEPTRAGQSTQAGYRPRAFSPSNEGRASGAEEADGTPRIFGAAWAVSWAVKHGYRLVRRIVIAVVGFSVVLVGLAMIIGPGPAVLVIPLGLAILAVEFRWARRLLRYARQRLQNGIRDLTRSAGGFAEPPQNFSEKLANGPVENSAESLGKDGRTNGSQDGPG